jgi:hypothetical protein
MEWIVSNKNNKIKLAVIVALVAFSTVFLVTGLMMSVVYGAPTLDDKLRNMDAAMDHLVNVCWKENFKSMCLDTLEDAWWIDCSEWNDKLDTCKNGKIEDILKANGRPT